MMPAPPLPLMPALALPNVQPVAAELPVAAESFAALLSQSTATEASMPTAPLQPAPAEQAPSQLAEIPPPLATIFARPQLANAEPPEEPAPLAASNAQPKLAQQPVVGGDEVAMKPHDTDYAETIADLLPTAAEAAPLPVAVPMAVPAATPPLPALPVATLPAPTPKPAASITVAATKPQTQPAPLPPPKPKAALSPAALNSANENTPMTPEGELFEIKPADPAPAKIEQPPLLSTQVKDSAAPSITMAAPTPAPIEPELDLAQGNQWLDRIAKEIVAMRQPTGDLAFRLVPAELGKLDIALKQGDNGLSITLETQSEKAQDIITAAQPRLVEELRAQGVRVADAQISHGSSSERQPMPHHRPQTDHSNERQNANTQTESENAPETRGRFA
jgi:flagellar hook-length control protein FliK